MILFLILFIIYKKKHKRQISKNIFLKKIKKIKYISTSDPMERHVPFWQRLPRGIAVNYTLRFLNRENDIFTHMPIHFWIFGGGQEKENSAVLGGQIWQITFDWLRPYRIKCGIWFLGGSIIETFITKAPPNHFFSCDIFQFIIFFFGTWLVGHFIIILSNFFLFFKKTKWNVFDIIRK